MNIPFSPPDMTELEVEGAADAIRSGWITTGPKTKEFEKRIAAYVHAAKVVCLNSQTACAEMALRLLGVGAGDEVLVPAYTYTATASVVCHVGAVLKFVDSQKGSFEMDYDALENAVTKRTKAIICVDLGGVPCDYGRIFSICKQKRGLFCPTTHIQQALGRIAVCADAAHAFGASWHGKMVGSVADFTSFSWHAVKNLTTAEGGALAWKTIPGIDDCELYHLAQMLSLHGQSKDALEKTRLGEWEYDIIGPWYKCNMTDIMAGIGLAQLKRYRGILERRKQIIQMYDAAFQPLGIEVLPHYTQSCQSCGHLYMTRVPGVSIKQRQEVIVKMAEAGVACNVHYKPLPMMTAYKKMGFDIKDYPNAYERFANEITLPLHTKLTDQEVRYVADAYSRVLADYI